MYVSVTNGTNAGWKRPRPKGSDWRCPSCGKWLKHFWVTCPNDNSHRPDPQPATANVSANDVLPRTWRVISAIAGTTPAATYTVAASVIV